RKPRHRASPATSKPPPLPPTWSDAYFTRPKARRAKKDYAWAVTDFREAIRLDPKDADALSGLAWLLSTCPETSVRDGKKAVEHATRACELTSWDAPYFLAALGAAWAEPGAFDEATKWQKRAPRPPPTDPEDA